MTKKLLLQSVFVLASATLASNALAQEGGAGTDEDVIVVTASPIRDSQAAAINAKRNAVNVADVISADTIGRFPDQNLADSLGRVPGLAIERDQGQARYINFRGAPFRYTAIAFDGIDVIGAENGRIPRFDAFPSVITSKIEVNKAITPDMPGESVAGFINIHTFNPFDRDGFSFSLEGGVGQQELGDADIEKYNGRISWSGEKWGVLAYGSHNLRGRITDNREYDLTQVGEQLIPNELDFRSYRGDREDNAYGGKVEFRPTDESRIFFSSLYSEFIDREERNQFVFDFAGGHAAVYGEGAPAPEAGYEPIVLVSRLLENGEYTNSTFTNTLGYDFGVKDWDIEARLSYTQTENITELPIPYSAGGTAAAAYDISDIENPQVTLFNPLSMDPLADINSINYAASFIYNIYSELNTDAYKGKLDASRDMTLFGQDATVKIGGQIDMREAEGGSAQAQDFVTPAVSGIDFADFATDTPWSADFDNTINATNYDNKGLYDALKAAGMTRPAFADDSLIEIDESIYAIYAMSTFEQDWGSVVLGARVEATDFETSGNALVGGAVEPIEASNDYVHFLPSAHLNYDLSDDTKLRLSVTTGVSRPTYNELRASVSVDVTDTPFEANGGNPDLDAEYAWGVDSSLEWYFAPASIFSVGAFARYVDNVIYPDTVVIEDGSTVAPGIIAAGTPVTFNSFYNGEDGKLFGVEANFIGQATFLPEPFDGFGATANVTILDSSFEAPTRNASYSLPGTSDLVFNSSVFYEKFGLSARVNYQYRDAWLSTTENDSLSEYWDATERVDASVRYAIPGDVNGVTFTVFANGNNLTDERDRRYIGSPATPNQYKGFGRRYVVGLRADY